jgi:hypothetical protein
MEVPESGAKLECSKHWNTAESSTFGWDFIAATTTIKVIDGVRCRLRMMGLSVDGPTSMFGNAGSVVTNAPKLESTLKKSHNVITYPKVRKAQDAMFVSFTHERGSTHLADVLSEAVPGPRLRDLAAKIMW